MIRALIFDMDGVLIDAKEWHYEALNRALKLFGYEIDRYEHLTTFDGLPTRKKLEILSRDKGLPVQLHNFLNDLKQQYTMDITFQKCRPNFGHQYLLAQLKAMGYRLAVASNSIRETVNVMMRKAELLEYFDVVLSNQDVPRPKPAPDIYLKAAQLLGLSPSECLVIEDNEKGIEAAQSAGAKLHVVKSTQEVRFERISPLLQLEGTR